MKCEYCGADLPDNAKFCTNCGQPQPRMGEAAQKEMSGADPGGTAEEKGTAPEETGNGPAGSPAAEETIPEAEETIPEEEPVSPSEHPQGQPEAPPAGTETAGPETDGAEGPEIPDASGQSAEDLAAGGIPAVDPVGKKKVPLIPVIIGAVVLVVILLAVALHNGGGGGGDDEYGSSSSVTNYVNPYVQMVKGGHPTSYPNRNYGEAFGSFFSHPSWRYFESDQGKDVVEFNGGCLYDGHEVEVCVQFVLDVAGGSFETAYLSFNDVPQNRLMLSALIEKVFTS